MPKIGKIVRAIFEKNDTSINYGDDLSRTKSEKSNVGRTDWRSWFQKDSRGSPKNRHCSLRNNRFTEQFPYLRTCPVIVQCVVVRFRFSCRDEATVGILARHVLNTHACKYKRVFEELLQCSQIFWTRKFRKGDQKETPFFPKRRSKGDRFSTKRTRLYNTFCCFPEWRKSRKSNTTSILHWNYAYNCGTLIICMQWWTSEMFHHGF